MDDDVIDVPDVLGDAWSARTIPLAPDGRSKGGVDPVATLVSPAGSLGADGPRRERAVLYLHGFVDYFLGFNGTAGLFWAVLGLGYGLSDQPAAAEE